MGEQVEQRSSVVDRGSPWRDGRVLSRSRRPGRPRGGDGWEHCEVEVLAERSEPGRCRFWVHIHIEGAPDGFPTTSPSSALRDLRADGWDLVPVFAAESFELRHQRCRRMGQERPPRAPRPGAGAIEVVESCVGWRPRPVGAGDDLVALRQAHRR